MNCEPATEKIIYGRGEHHDSNITYPNGCKRLKLTAFPQGFLFSFSTVAKAKWTVTGDQIALIQYQY